MTFCRQHFQTLLLNKNGCISIQISLIFIPTGQISSLWPCDTIWRYRSESTLAQVMACCLIAPSHYLYQCWCIIEVQCRSSQGNSTRDTSTINHQNYLSKMSSKSPRGHWVNNNPAFGSNNASMKHIFLNAQIPQCTSPISHNAPFCNRNISATKWCIVGYLADALWDLWGGPIGFDNTICDYIWNNNKSQLHSKFFFKSLRTFPKFRVLL